MKQESQAAEVGPAIERVLVTFREPVCIPASGSAVFATALICEYVKGGDKYSPELTVVGFPDGKKLTKSFKLMMTGSMDVICYVPIEDGDL